LFWLGRLWCFSSLPEFLVCPPSYSWASGSLLAEELDITEDCSLLAEFMVPRDDFIMSRILFLVFDGVFDFLRLAVLLPMPLVASDLSWLAEFWLLACCDRVRFYDASCSLACFFDCFLSIT